MKNIKVENITIPAQIAFQNLQTQGKLNSATVRKKHEMAKRHWSRKFNPVVIDEIQEKCSSVMEKMDYEKVESHYFMR